jgi:hypothetical protein
MSNTGRIPLWLIGLVGGLQQYYDAFVIYLWFILRFRIIIIIIIFNIHC